jgi:hypothetical protein
VLSQKPPRGTYPKGAYHSSKEISAKLFSSDSKDRQDCELTQNHMPFLFDLLLHKLNKGSVNIDSRNNSESDDNQQSSDEGLVNHNRGVHNTVLQEVFLSKARNARLCCASAASFILSSF